MTGSVVFGWLPQPIGGMQVIQQPFFDSFFAFLTHDATHRNVFGGYTFASSGYIPAGRNSLVNTFLNKTTGDWLLMLDWDISYNPEHVYMLLDAVGEDTNRIITGCYVTFFGDNNSLRPCWFTQTGEEEYIPATEFVAGEIIPLTVCGMGFTLMHRDALLKMEKGGNDDPWPWFGHDVINADRVGEDLTFSKRARACGLTLWGHGGVELGHTKTKTFWPVDMTNPAFANSDVAPRVRPVDKTVLDVGGGSKSFPLPLQYAGWNHVLLDIDPASDADIVMDARELVNAPGVSFTTSNSTPQDLLLAQGFDAVYLSHNLEHYATHEVSGVLAGCNKVLKEDGVLHIRVPDMLAMMKKVVEEDCELDDMLYLSPGGPITARDMMYGYGKAIEESGESYMCHKTGFTESLLRRTLESAGFIEVQIETHDLELEATARKLS